METRKIASVGTAAGNHTTLWQPLPDGPVITIPAGSTNVPVTSVAGFAVGQKIGIGYGATYPAVAKAMEKYEVATVTAVGKPGTQAWLAADAQAGATNIKVSSVANISAGDKIRLDIDSVGHGIETVTVTRVGTQSVRNTFNGPLRDTELGTGLDLAAPLKFNHAANLPFSDRGTGSVHSRRRRLPTRATSPSSRSAPASRSTARWRRTTRSTRWCVTPRSRPRATRERRRPTSGSAARPLASAGSMVLRDAAGLVVDSLNYGLPRRPMGGRGLPGTSGAGQSGCRVPAPGAGRGGGRRAGGSGRRHAASGARAASRTARDTDSNCTDFLLQPATTLSAASAAGATNIKVASVADFAAGQTIMIDAGANLETAVIATVGTAGATTVGAATSRGRDRDPCRQRGRLQRRPDDHH